MFATRWSPIAFRDVWSEMNRLQQELDRVYGGRGNGDRGVVEYPAVNLWQDADKFYVEAELPGLILEDLEIYVHQGNQLQIRGERKQPAEEGANWHRRERGYGQFSRTLELPAKVDAKRVTAQLNHGVLLIELPKREEAKPRRIEVSAG